MPSSAEEATWDTPAKQAEMLALLEQRGEWLSPILKDADTLQRFLRARKGEPGPALDMLLKHQLWRRRDTPWWPAAGCPLHLVEADVRSKKAYAHGLDATGSPIFWVRPALHDKNEDRQALKHFIAFINDEGVARILAPPGSPDRGLIIVLDFEGFGYSAGFDPGAGIDM